MWPFKTKNNLTVNLAVNGNCGTCVYFGSRDKKDKKRNALHGTCFLFPVYDTQVEKNIVKEDSWCSYYKVK